MILMSIDFSLRTIFFQESPQSSLSSHPENGAWHSGFFGTSSFTSTAVSALSDSFLVKSSSGSGVNSKTFSYNQTISNKFSNRHPYENMSERKYKGLLELAREISLASLGSSQTLFLPHFKTEAANLF